CPRARHAMQDYFGIRGRGKNRALELQFFSLLTRKRQISVVTDSDLTVLASHDKRLAFANRNFSGRGIADMANGAWPCQTIQQGLIETLTHVTHGPLRNQLAAVGGDDTARF